LTFFLRFTAEAVGAPPALAQHFFIFPAAVRVADGVLFLLHDAIIPIASKKRL
jgi:hypothetical protein